MNGWGGMEGWKMEGKNVKERMGRDGRKGNNVSCRVWVGGCVGVGVIIFKEGKRKGKRFSAVAVRTCVCVCVCVCLCFLKARERAKEDTRKNQTKSTTKEKGLGWDWEAKR
jgi:hypothetical protein